jgi:hypothetical protein
MKHFCLADFPGAPGGGRREISIEMPGRRNEPQTVQWHGLPWQGGLQA